MDHNLAVHIHDILSNIGCTSASLTIEEKAYLYIRHESDVFTVVDEAGRTNFTVKGEINDTLVL